MRETLGLSRYQIHLYRKAGLFPFEPIGVSHGGLWKERVYDEAALTTLEILEALRKAGFGLKAMRVLFCTGIVGEGMSDFISFDEKSRIVIAPERLQEAKRITEAVIKSYPLGYNLPPQGERPFGKG